MQSSDSSSSLALLPHEVLVNVVRWLEPQERFSTCAPACRSFHAAAVAATEELELSCRTQQHADAAAAWLERHGSSALIKLSFESRICCSFSVAMPWHTLRRMQDLKMSRFALQPQPGNSSSSGSRCEQRIVSDSCKLSQLHSHSSSPMAVPLLMALTALTQLRIWDCDVTCFGDGMLQLTALSGLQSLSVYKPHVRPGSVADAAAYSTALASMLGQLRQLTYLSLEGGSCDHPTLFKSGAVLKAACNLSRLQALRLQRVGTMSDPARLKDLPGCLTKLEVEGGAISSSSSSSSSSDASPPIAVSRSRDSCQLMNLRKVYLNHPDCDPAVLGCMRHITDLCWFAEA
jgi:hypothetical protein